MSAIASLTVPAAVLATAPSDDARKARDAAKKQEAEQALQTLKGMNKRVSDDRKAAARQKLDQLKARLQQLRMIGASPAQLAQIAKELARAVKEYGAAGGTGEVVAATPQAAQASAPEAGAEVTAEEGAETAQVVTEPETTAPTTEGDEAAPGAKPENPYDKAMRALQEDSDRQARRSAEAEDDRTFLEAARALARALKAAAAEAARKAAQDGPGARQDADAAAQAAQDAEQVASDAEKAAQDSAGISLNI